MKKISSFSCFTMDKGPQNILYNLFFQDTAVQIYNKVFADTKVNLKVSPIFHFQLTTANDEPYYLENTPDIIDPKLTAFLPFNFNYFDQAESIEKHFLIMLEIRRTLEYFNKKHQLGIEKELSEIDEDKLWGNLGFRNVHF